MTEPVTHLVNIESILAPERTCCDLQATSKKRAIEEIAQHLARVTHTLSAEDIYERLIGRETLGTTAIGNGIAIPHCRIEDCHEIIGGLYKLASPIDFEAFDDEPVSLLFVLLVPAEEVDEHLHALAMLAQHFESAQFRQNLMSATNDTQLFEQAIKELPADHSV